jgi:hypothetical protein
MNLPVLAQVPDRPALPELLLHSTNPPSPPVLGTSDSLWGIYGCTAGAETLKPKVRLPALSRRYGPVSITDSHPAPATELVKAAYGRPPIRYANMASSVDRVEGMLASGRSTLGVLTISPRAAHGSRG